MSATAAQTPADGASEKRRGTCSLPIERTWREWFLFILNLGSIALIVMGAIFFNNCSGIPSLPYYCFFFGALSLSHGIVVFIYRIDAVQEIQMVFKDEELTSGSVEVSKQPPGRILAAIITVFLMGVTIWGAVVTWPRVADPQCEEALFMSGFISSIINIAIVGSIIVGYILFRIWLKLTWQRQPAKKPSESGPAQASMVAADIPAQASEVAADAV